MTKKVKIIQCDRCGKTKMLNRIDSGREGALDTYERPDGWTVDVEYKKDLCPECFTKLKTILDEFYGGNLE